MKNRIAAIALIGSIMGLMVELFALFMPLLPQGGVQAMFFFKLLSPDINLSYMNTDLFRPLYFNSQLSGSILSLTFYLLFLIGSILFIKSKAKEIRLLRMSFSLILLNNILSTLSIIIFILFSYVQISFSHHIVLGVNIASCIIWSFLTYFALKEISKGIFLSKSDISDASDGNYIDASTSQRFTHHIIDFILCMSMVFPFSLTFFARILPRDIHLFNDSDIGIVLIIITSNLIYYIFFEVLFGTTPAKYLSGARVIMTNGKETINFTTGVLRTLVRSVPFEPFSFLISENGWHDKWSSTRVVKEVNTGVNPKKYFWILALLAGLMIVGTISYHGIEKYKGYKYKKNNFDKKTEQILSHIDHLTTEHFIGINEINNRYYISDKLYYLKPEKIEGDSIVCSFFQMPGYPNTYNIQLFYETHKYSFYDSDTILLSKEELYASIEKDYNNYDEQKIKGYKIFHNSDTAYYIEKIHKAYEPDITLRGTGGYSISPSGGSASIDLNNYGYLAKLVSLENIEGNLEFLNTLPITIDTSEESWQTTTIEVGNFDLGKSYKFKMTVIDQITLKEQEYIISGINNRNEIERVK